MNKVAKKSLTSSQFLKAVMGLKRTSGTSLWVTLEYTSQSVEITLQDDQGEYSAEVWYKDQPVELTEKQSEVLKKRMAQEVDRVADEIRQENYTEQWDRPYHPYNSAHNYIMR